MAIDLAQLEPSEQTLVPDPFYEVIDGEIVETPPMGTRQQITAVELLGRLWAFAQTANCGRAVMETLFDFTDQVGRKRRPDVAYVSYQRWPADKPIPDGDGWPVVPNLAVEVISPTNTWDDVRAKVHEYFHVGVERVWVVGTTQRELHIYQSPTAVTILGASDEIADESLLPGFRAALGDVFPLMEDRAES